jgi:hypothetical protein
MRLFCQPAHAANQSQLAEWLIVLEIGTVGIVATLAAHRLGLQRIDLLMAIYFSITFSGQFVATLLGKIGPRAYERQSGND